MTVLYNCKSEIDAVGKQAYRITKFDHHMNVESSYLTDGRTCNCPAGERPMCRHRKMLPMFTATNRVNTNWFYDFDRGGWVQIAVDLGEVEDSAGDEGMNQNTAESVAETFEMSVPPPGITILDLSKTSPETLFNTIADAVGEPRNQPRSPSINRRGF